MVLAVGLAVGVGIVEASTMMLVPTTSEVALSVAVAVRDAIGVGVLTGEDLTGAIVGYSLMVGLLWTGELWIDAVGVGEAVSDVGNGLEATGDEATGEETAPDAVGNSLNVALPEVGTNVGEALSGERVEEGSSDAGTLKGMLLRGVEAGDAEVPIAPVPDGVTPGLSDPVGTTLPEIDAEGVTLAFPEVGGRLEERASEVGTPEDKAPEVGVGTTPVGTEPDEGKTPDDGRTPEDDREPVGTIPDDGSTPEDGRVSDSKLEGKMVGKRLGMLPVPVGNAEPEDSEDTIVGIRLGMLVGAVPIGPEPVGKMPGRSDGSSELRSPSKPPELVATASDVGIAPEPRGVEVGVATEPVPNAVVIPMTMPEEDTGDS